MEFLASFLPIIIYILLIIFIIIGIVIGLKFINILDKTEKIVNDVDEKLNSLNPIFDIANAASSKITRMYDYIIDFVGGIVNKLFMKKKEEMEDDYE